MIFHSIFVAFISFFFTFFGFCFAFGFHFGFSFSFAGATGEPKACMPNRKLIKPKKKKIIRKMFVYRGMRSSIILYHTKYYIVFCLSNISCSTLWLGYSQRISMCVQWAWWHRSFLSDSLIFARSCLIRLRAQLAAIAHRFFVSESRRRRR